MGVETGFGKKNDYMAYLKDYMKNVVKYLEEHNRAGEVDTFKKNINGVIRSSCQVQRSSVLPRRVHESCRHDRPHRVQRHRRRGATGHHVLQARIGGGESLK